MTIEVDMAPTKTPNTPRGTIRGASSYNVVNFTIRAVPLPRNILEFLLDNILVLKRLQQETDKSAEQNHESDNDTEEDELNQEGVDTQGDLYRKPTVKPEQYWDVLREKCKEAGAEWKGIVDKIQAFGPRRAGGCMLIDARKDIIPNS